MAAPEPLLKTLFQSTVPQTAKHLLRSWRSLRHQRPLPESVCENIAYEASTTIDESLLIATPTGILLYRRGVLRRILRGRFYGISRSQDRWCAYHGTGQIVSFELRQDGVADLQCLVSPLHLYCHQIDFCGEFLFVVDTNHNRLIRFPRQLPQDRSARHAYPNGRVWRGRRSPNYCHMNSVLSDGETTLVVLHNQTGKTGKKSELIRLDSNLNVTGRRTLNAGAAHNVVALDGRIGYCDSLAGEFVHGEKRLSLGPFTRGVAITEDAIFIGGSEFGNRKQREGSAGFVYCCPRDASSVTSTMQIPQVDGVCEVRLVDTRDSGSSETCRVLREAGRLDLDSAFDQMPDYVQAP